MRFQRLWLEWLLIGISASLALFLAEKAEIFKQSERLIYDMAAPLRAAPVNDDIVIVAIDNESLTALGQWPWSRTLHAKALNRLHAARPSAILFNALFIEPTPDDAALAAAMKGPAPLFLPILLDKPGPNGAPYWILRPVPAIARAASGLGIVNLEIEDDGKARSVWPAIKIDNAWQPHIVELAYRRVRAMPSPAYRRAMTSQAPAYLAFHQPGTFPVISFDKLLRGDISQDRLRGKIVIIGATAAGLGDLYPVPGSATQMSGSEIQANLLGSLLTDRFITPVPTQWVIALSLLPLWILLTAFRRLTPSQGLILSIGMTGAIILGSLLSLALAGIWFPPVAALLGIVIVYPLWGWRRLAAVTQFIEQEIDALLKQARITRFVASTEIAGDRVAERTGRLHQIINFMRHTAAEREEMLQFLSHDMRAPQAAIIALLEGEDGQNLAESDRQLRTRIRRYAETTLQLAEDFVQLARLETQGGEREPVDVTDAMAQAIDIVWPRAHMNGIAIERQWPQMEDLWIMGDAAALVRAFTNLLSNAVAESPPGSAICCTVSREGNYAAGSVRDQGRGLPLERRADPFSRFGYSGVRSGARGSGLGLAYVEAVARFHDGEAIYADAPGGGACFTLRLPLTAETLANPDQAGS